MSVSPLRVQLSPRPARPGRAWGESAQEVVVGDIEATFPVLADSARSVAEVAVSGARFCLWKT